MSSIESEILELVKGVLNTRDLKLEAHTLLSGLRGWDSVRFMTLLVAIEKKHKVRFQANEVVAVQTWSDLLDLVRKKTA